jgi:hypothetical protein
MSHSPRARSSMSAPVATCPGPVSRRSFLQAGTLGLGGLGLADLFRLRAVAGEAAKDREDTSVIFVWLPGGPPHMDMYDMKPNAPAEYRGAFQPIATNVPGLDVCELMPLHAKCADKYSVIRSISHNYADHGGGHKKLMAARDPKTPVDTVLDYPACPSIVAKCREDRQIGLPNYISFTDGGREGVDVFAFGSAYLGPAYVPFAIPGDPSRPEFKVNNISLDNSLSDRLDNRLALLGQFDRLKRTVDKTGTMAAMDGFNSRAASILTSDRARKAFDLSQEPDHIKTRYGKHAWGTRLLLARRLVEAGCSFVTVVVENPYQSGIEWLKAGTYNWDSHAVNCHIWNDAQIRFPLYDQAVTALIEDMYARGIDKKTLLVVTGEFGRTPRVNSTTGSQTGVMQPGRDHWPSAMSLIVSGGGLRTGQVIGSTNAKGEVPKDRPLVPGDLWATVFRHLGIDPERSFLDHSGRPMPILSEGTPIAELG